MNLERGFRRLFVVLSVAVLGSGIALDAGKLWSHARIYVTTSFGEALVFETWTLAGSPPYERDPATRQMVHDLFWASLKPVTDPRLLEELEKAPPDPLEGAIPFDPVIKTFRVVRGPFSWSWEDFKFTPIATGIVVLLWAGFFALRWVVRGFTYQQTP